MHSRRSDGCHSIEISSEPGYTANVLQWRLNARAPSPHSKNQHMVCTYLSQVFQGGLWVEAALLFFLWRMLKRMWVVECWVRMPALQQTQRRRKMRESWWMKAVFSVSAAGDFLHAGLKCGIGQSDALELYEPDLFLWVEYTHAAHTVLHYSTLFYIILHCNWCFMVVWVVE